MLHQLRPHSRWKVSLLKMGGSFSFLPGGPGKPKAIGKGGLGEKAASGRGEVTPPQSYSCGARQASLELSQLRLGENDSHPPLVGLSLGGLGRHLPATRGAHLSEAAIFRPEKAIRTQQLQEYLFIYLFTSPGGWPLNLYIQHGALAFYGLGWVQAWVLRPLSRAVDPRDRRWDAPEPAAASSSKR